MEQEEKTFEQQVEDLMAETEQTSNEQQSVAVVSVLDVEPVAKTVEQISHLVQVVQELKSVVGRLAEQMDGMEQQSAALKEELAGTQRAVIKFADHVASKLSVQVQQKALDLADKSVMERSAVRMASENASVPVKIQHYFPNNAPGG